MKLKAITGKLENDYIILIYYRSLGGRYDQLVGVSRVNSLSGRPGLR